MSDTDYLPSPSGWVRAQVEKIEATGDTRSVHIMNRPVVMLTMRGAKTGGIRKVPLMRVEHDGVYAAVASQGGAPEHPKWYGNLQADRRRRLAGRHEQGREAALERRDPLLHGILRRVHDPGVDVPELLEREQVCRVGGVVEDVGRGLVDRQRPGAGGAVGHLSGVDLRGLEAPLRGVGHRCLPVIRCAGRDRRRTSDVALRGHR